MGNNANTKAQRRKALSHICRSVFLIFCISAIAFVLPLGQIASASTDKITYSLAAANRPDTAKGHPKMDSFLDDLVAAYEKQGLDAARGLAAENNWPLKGDSVQVILDTPDASLASQVVDNLGGKTEGISGHLVQASVSLSTLSKLANDAAINYIRRPLPATLAGIVSEGVALTRAPAWHNNDYKGWGVKIAVLDLGFTGYQSLLGTELPASVTARSFRQDGDITGGSERHGTACAELVYDMAPEATLYLVNFSTEVEFAQAVDWLIQQGVHMISSSVCWVNAGPYDGTGVICDIVENAYQHGILWANAMGNSTRRHWEGRFQDSDADQWHEFDSGVEVNALLMSVRKGQQISVFLSWNDSWAAASQDYALYLFRWHGNEWDNVAISDNPQNGQAGQTPTEEISIPAPKQATYGVAIARIRATGTEHLELYSFTHDFTVQVNSSSLLIPADAVHALSMGVYHWNTGQLETFSSHGPNNNGVVKPDLVAPDFVTTVTYGSQGFSGTSTGSPYTVGAAALVKQAHPMWGPSEITTYLKDAAAPHPAERIKGFVAPEGNNPPNNATGSGDLGLGDPPTPTAVTLASFTARVENYAAVIRWETASEVNNVGFNLYRSSGGTSGHKIQLNAELIPSQAPGGLGGASYTFRDASIVPGTLYAYWLQDLDNRGVAMLHGPITLEWPNAAPKPVQVRPNDSQVSVNTWKTFAATYRDENGVNDLRTVFIGIASNPAGLAQGVQLKYDAMTGLIHLWNGTGWSEGKAPGSNSTLSNNLVTVRLQQTRVAASNGEVLQIQWSLRFKDAFRGTRNIYLRAVDRQNASSNWLRGGRVQIE